MEMWEVIARESIRDIVARYNANGDTGRIPQVMELFADDAVMETGTAEGGMRTYTGKAEVESIFTGAIGTFGEAAKARKGPPWLRHCTATHQIDFVDKTHAKGRCYYFVLMYHGLDHWGRYIDQYEERDGRWLFTYRKVTTDSRHDWTD